VWINVRESALPDLPFWPQVLENARLGPDRRIVDAFSQGFFLRELVVTPDGQTLLNPQAESFSASASTMLHRSHFAYAQTKPLELKNMLAAALRRFQARAELSGKNGSGNR
jgi:hypothetical protein